MAVLLGVNVDHVATVRQARRLRRRPTMTSTLIPALGVIALAVVHLVSGRIHGGAEPRLRLLSAARGVSVAYCDSPGPLDAGQKTFYAVAPLPDGWTPEQVYEEYVQEMALRRVTTAEDIANAVLFLATDESRNMTGQCLTVDGGWDV